MKLTLVISGLDAGGAERVLTNMANFWADRGWTITVLTLADQTVQPFYHLDSRIRHIPLGIARESPYFLVGFWNNLRRICVLREAIQESHPEAVISFVDKTNVLTLLATAAMKTKVLVSERTDPKSHFIGHIWNLLRFCTYLKADHIIVQTHRARKFFHAVIQAKIVVIPNPVTLNRVTPHPSLNDGFQSPFIVSVGRLVEEKGFDLLVRAFARLAGQFPEWTLRIIGDGPLHSSLESLCNELGIVGRVRFLGLVQNPYDILSKAELFVLSSRFEGFPNALLEAMASGRPVIATDCPSGPREIIQDRVNGMLVPTENEEALASAMEFLMGNELERKRLGSCALEVAEHYRPEKIMRRWEEVLS